MGFSFIKNKTEKTLIGRKKHELEIEEEDQLEKNLVWIFASPRSGTQWLGTQLLEYNTVVNHGPSLGLHVGALHGGFNNKIVRLIEFRGDEPDYFLSKKYKDVWSYFLRKLILNRLYAQYHTLTKKIIIPDPEGSIGADIVTNCVPNSKAIILFRDGRDVVDSIIDAAKPGSWHVKSRGVEPVTPKNRIKRIGYASRRWVRQVEILEDVFENKLKNSMKIKYEDLRRNTLEELEKIYHFIGIEISKEKLEEIISKHSFENISKDQKGSGKVTRSASPGKWRENFSDEEKNIMLEFMGDTLKRLGYLDLKK